MGYLVRNPKRSLGTLGVLLAAAGLAAGSGAYFNDEVTSANSAAAGDVDLVVFGPNAPTTVDFNTCTVASPCNSESTMATPSPADDATLFTITNLRPTSGSLFKRRLRLRYDGSIPAGLQLVVDNTGDQELLDAARIVIERTGNPNQGFGGGTLINDTLTGANGTYNFDGFPNPRSATRQNVTEGFTTAVEVHVFLPNDPNATQNELQNKTVNTSLRLVATQFE